MKPDVVDSTSKTQCFQICTNRKTGGDHSCGKKTGPAIIIDSIVKLSIDTPSNTARLAGSAPPLKSDFTTEERLVSYNGGVPFAVLQLEDWNPSTPTQKMNNLHQVLDANPELDS